MPSNRYLIVGAMCSGFAALLHLGCIIFGGDWYRFLGAGEPMAQMAEAGLIYPAVVTAMMVALLTVWSLYGLSGAGVILKLPLLRLGLCTIATIYLLRGVAFILLMPLFPDNSMTFWVVSSTVCFILGLAYLLGVKRSWSYLGRKSAAVL